MIRKRWLRMVIVCLTLCSVWGIAQLEAGKGKKAARRARRVTGPEQSESGVGSSEICPQFVYMHYATYCSYYATVETSCQWTSYDSANCNLPQGDCYSGSGCLTNVSGDLPKDDIRLQGYGVPDQPKAIYTNDFPQLAGPAATKAKVKPVDLFAIKFPGPGGQPLYAQIFIAEVTAAGGQLPVAILGRGTEIEPTTEVRYDYTQTPADELPVEPVADQGHAYRYEFDEKSIQIITHFETPSHGE